MKILGSKKDEKIFIFAYKKKIKTEGLFEKKNLGIIPCYNDTEQTCLLCPRWLKDYKGINNEIAN